MKYFTPELYQQFNSLDVNEAEPADKAWDNAESAYRQRLESIREQFPSQVVKLSELCLHDALVVSREEQEWPAGLLFSCLWPAVAIFSVAIGDEVVSLIYLLGDRITTCSPPEGWRFSKLQEQWLYDEVDMIDDHKGPFVHRILFSTGVSVEIPFVSVIIHRFKVPAAALFSKQSA